MKLRLIFLSVIIAAFVTGCMSGMKAPENLDTSTTRTSDAGLFSVTIKPELEPVAINKIHSWTLHLETADGKPVEDAEITIDGGMPQHGHGLPTKPEMTENMGNGDYRVEGMKFQMPGWWEVKFAISAKAGSDNVTFNLKLQ